MGGFGPDLFGPSGFGLRSFLDPAGCFWGHFGPGSFWSDRVILVLDTLYFPHKAFGPGLFRPMFQPNSFWSWVISCVV